MLYVYLFATILGGVLLGASFVGGDSDHGHDPGGDHSLGIFSLRLWTYVLAFGGVTGLLLTTLTGTGVLVAGLLAGAVGAGAGVAARTVIQRALTEGTGGTVTPDQLVGKSAQVLVPFKPGTTGTVRLTVKNSTVDLMATCDADEGELGEKEDVLIVEVREGRALVTRNPAAVKGLKA